MTEDTEIRGIQVGTWRGYWDISDIPGVSMGGPSGLKTIRPTRPGISSLVIRYNEPRSAYTEWNSAKHQRIVDIFSKLAGTPAKKRPMPVSEKASGVL